MDITEIGGMGFAPTLKIAADPRLVRLEEAVLVIRKYAFGNKLTGEQLETIFNAGLQAQGFCNEGERRV